MMKLESRTAEPHVAYLLALCFDVFFVLCLSANVGRAAVTMPYSPADCEVSR